MERFNGKVIQTAELATDYGFVDADGEVPVGPFSGIEAAKQSRLTMTTPLAQYNLDADLPDPLETNDPEAAALFPGA